MKYTVLAITATVITLSACSTAQKQDLGGDPIRVNQVGYYPQQEKTAVIEQEAACDCYTLTDAQGKTVWEGAAVREATSPWSGKVRQVIDFSSVKQPGTYTLHAGNYSQQVIIADHALQSLAQSTMQSYYMQRSGCVIEEQYAGAYARPLAHPDTVVYVHPSAASKGRPAGAIISSPCGWYDAGDFNKYIVNSAFTTGMMLDVYQQAKTYFDAMPLNIPEHGDTTPDFLDEIMYNLKWMVTMQDPTDGGVYHKLTTPSFEAFIMPVEAQQPRYVVKKTTTAALDYAASMAQAARLYQSYPAYTAFCTQALQAAEMAYRWAVKHPDTYYLQDEMNEHFEPKISTGAYDDSDVSDEFFWASTELYLSTGKAAYLKDVQRYMPIGFKLPVWGNVAALATFDWINNSDNEQAKALAGQLCPSLLAYADAQIEKTATSCYNSPFGNVADDFHWASIPESCAGVGIVLMYAYKLTGNEKYLTGAQQNIDYMLGRNATGYCYVTGFGTKPVMHPHQRISTADGIEAPVPGLVSGGPNPGQQDKANLSVPYPSDYPDESYLDHHDSYASNEIAINWNAYVVGLTGWLDYMR